MESIQRYTCEAGYLFATLPDDKQAVLVDQAKVCWSHGHEFGLAIQKIALPETPQELYYGLRLDLEYWRL